MEKSKLRNIVNHFLKEGQVVEVFNRKKIEECLEEYIDEASLIELLEILKERKVLEEGTNMKTLIRMKTGGSNSIRFFDILMQNDDSSAKVIRLGFSDSEAKDVWDVELSTFEIEIPKNKEVFCYFNNVNLNGFPTCKGRSTGSLDHLKLRLVNRTLSEDERDQFRDLRVNGIIDFDQSELIDEEIKNGVEATAINKMSEAELKVEVKATKKTKIDSGGHRMIAYSEDKAFYTVSSAGEGIWLWRRRRLMKSFQVGKSKIIKLILDR